MKPQTVILAFLAGRYPAAYDAQTITIRVNASRIIDKRLTDDDTNDALRTLVRLGKFVESDVDKLSGTLYWNATQDGVKQWHADGRLHVGG